MNLDIQNADGLTPKDLALMYKHEEERVRIMVLINKDLTMTIKNTNNDSFAS
jgi:hypothetical protein